MTTWIPGKPSHVRIEASVKWFDAARGYGFLALLDGQPDVFCHISVVRGAGFETLPEGATVVAYCSVGYRSARLAAALRDRGLADVHNLEGSIFRWANEDRPLFRGDTPVRRVHPFDETWGVLLAPDRRAYSP